jgi:hypothetical protein
MIEKKLGRVCTHHGLEVDLWVPVRVKQDNDISSCKVDTKTTSSCAQHEDEFGTTRSIELINGSLSTDLLTVHVIA